MGDRDGTTVMRRGAGVTRWLKRFRWLPLVAVGAIGSLMLPTPSAAQGPPLSEGLVCTTNKTSSFVLNATPGYISTPDGNSVFMWSYANANSSFQYPGPVLCVNEGDNVTVTLKNSLPVPTSLVFPGLTEVKADGQLVQLDVGSGSLSKPAQPAGSVTYTFQATNPGTFLYQSGTDPELQVLMGLAGAIVVRPTKVTGPTQPDAAYVYDDASTAYDPHREFMHLLTEIDPHMHHAIELETCFQKDADPNCKQPTPLAYDMTKYQPRYWMINGRSFPDDITPNNSPALPNQPYGALVHVLPKTAQPLPALVRFLNAGPVNYPFHPHSNHDSAIGIDGRVLINKTGGPLGQPASTSFDRFGFVVAPGQTSDALFNWVDAQQWDPQSNPIVVTQPAAQNRTDGPYWSGSPYLGVKLPLLNGITQWNQCGEYYHFAHSHALFQATNYGTSGGGMLTLIRVDPPPDVQKKYGQDCTGGPGY
jgi:FtsP/CotA-like multicopper oxidase with cupredoxin domain